MGGEGEIACKCTYTQVFSPICILVIILTVFNCSLGYSIWSAVKMTRGWRRGMGGEGETGVGLLGFLLVLYHTW